MGRRPAHVALQIFLNNRHIGQLTKERSGAISFAYAAEWLKLDRAIPVSLSLPLRQDRYVGEPVSAVFENLLPDSADLKQLVAEQVGARGTDAFSLLSKIGRDCVGALQFLPVGTELPENSFEITGEALSVPEMEATLLNLKRAPLGIDNGQDFRISIAGAQEKTALLFHDSTWKRPHRTTPTTHIFKTQIGHLPGGLDLTNSVENEWYCLQLLQAFGLDVAQVEMMCFGETKALVIERFDRLWAKDGRLLRLPQEDFCQIRSVPPTLKYQNEGGPALHDILEVLKGSDKPEQDITTVLKAQIIFWLIGATDGHAKNFSVFLSPQGRYRLTPIYDVLSAQPALDQGVLNRRQMKLAMSVGNANHYRFDQIAARHFLQTAERAGVPTNLATKAIDEIKASADKAISQVESILPQDFPVALHHSITAAITTRLRML
ncbi:Serine/threonine-protein kinase HipA [Pseudovibrio sp. Ad13]|uniref:type II toxin-antitoxin system HipA family toxin n=1 Tax=Pseudovibrio sp. Ad13 TaxID=989396 RepID=UPI0007AEE377|nr:type II toxin-antitoxin system HipA family toxin [Pseudovibrio sp. Ad13]KZK84949.1 Serine/threonine-protein kinase HipA [Pseudovibrio sp. Ad13]